MKTMMKRILGVLLSLVLVLGFMPEMSMTVKAAESSYLILRDAVTGDTINFQTSGDDLAWQGSNAQTWCTNYYKNNLKNDFAAYIDGVDKSDSDIAIDDLFVTYPQELKGQTGAVDIDKVFFLSAEEFKQYKDINYIISFEGYMLRTTVYYSTFNYYTLANLSGTIGFNAIDDTSSLTNTRPALYLKSEFFKSYKDESGVRYWSKNANEPGYTASTSLTSELEGHTNKLLLNDETYWTVLGYKAKTPNTITITAEQSVTKTYSTSEQTETLVEATDAKGTVSYEIESQKNGGIDVSYFSLDGTVLTIGANTPAGTYIVVVKATAAGNEEYAKGSVTSTVTVTIEKESDPDPEPGQGGSGQEKILSENTTTYVVKNKSSITNLFKKYGESGYKYRFKVEDKSQRKVASVTRKGKIRVKKAGRVNISLFRKVKGGTWSRIEEKTLTTEKPVVTKKVTDLKVGDTLDALSFITNQKELVNTPTSYESTNTKVATVGYKTGKITILKKGTTKIKIFYGSGKGAAVYKTRIKVN